MWEAARTSQECTATLGTSLGRVGGYVRIRRPVCGRMATKAGMQVCSLEGLKDQVRTTLGGALTRLYREQKDMERGLQAAIREARVPEGCRAAKQGKLRYAPYLEADPNI